MMHGAYNVKLLKWWLFRLLHRVEDFATKNSGEFIAPVFTIT